MTKDCEFTESLMQRFLTPSFILFGNSLLRALSHRVAQVFTLTFCGFYLIVAFGLSSVPELKQKTMLLFSHILTVSERYTQVLSQKPNIVRRKILSHPFGIFFLFCEIGPPVELNPTLKVGLYIIQQNYPIHKQIDTRKFLMNLICLFLIHEE